MDDKDIRQQLDALQLDIEKAKQMLREAVSDTDRLAAWDMWLDLERRKTQLMRQQSGTVFALGGLSKAWRSCFPVGQAESTGASCANSSTEQQLLLAHHTNKQHME